MLALVCLALALTLAGVQQPVAEALSFWESEFSTTEFAQYRYKDLLTLSVFQHLKKNSSFYISPLILLDHKSGVLRRSIVTDFYELRFKVLMWDVELQDGVSAYLTKVKGVARPEVKLLPIEKVRFGWRSSSRPIRHVILESEIISMRHLPRYLTLKFACKTESACSKLHRQVEQHPEVVDSLDMDCFMSAQTTATKTITIGTENVLRIRTFSNLLSLPSDGNYRYMRSDDFNGLAQEIFSSVRASTVQSSEYVDRNDELNIMKLIEDALRHDEITSSSLSESQWTSVFWDPVFTRPDRVVRELSSLFTKNASTNRLDVNLDYLKSSESVRKVLTQSSSNVEGAISGELPIGGPFGRLLGLTVHASGGFKYDTAETKDSETRDQESIQTSFSLSQMNDALQESNLNALWEGEKFVPKPMRLTRINVRELRSKRELVSHNVQLTRHEKVVPLKVVVLATHNETWLLPGSPQSAFPTQFSYCLLSNGGSCPPGFRRSSGHMKAINMDTRSTGMIGSAQLGDSAIKCHSPGGTNNCAFRGWEPYKGELHLHVCCR